MAERAGFEPAWSVSPHPISSRRRCDRFGTSPDCDLAIRKISAQNYTFNSSIFSQNRQLTL